MLATHLLDPESCSDDRRIVMLSHQNNEDLSETSAKGGRWSGGWANGPGQCRYPSHRLICEQSTSTGRGVIDQWLVS